MVSDVLLWLVSVVIVVLVVALGVWAGAALVRIRDLGFGRALAIAAIVLAVDVACVALVAVGTTEFSEPLAAIFGVAGLVIGIAAPFIVLKLMLRQGWGRTVVVWAVHGVTAVLGFAAAGVIVSPGSPGAVEKAAQKRTVSDIKNSAAAVETWVIETRPAEGGGGSSDGRSRSSWVDVNDLDVISAAELRALVGAPGQSPYHESFPETDGWGHPFEYRVERGSGTITRLCIRSPGKDGRFEGPRYEAGGFAGSELDRDVVWADGSFIRWPE